MAVRLPVPLRDQRRDLRFRTDVPVVLRDLGQDHRYRSIDVSCSGLLLARRVPDEWKPSKRPVAIAIQRRGRPPLRLLALPVRVTWRAIALRFLLLDDLDRLALAELIDAQASLSAA